VILAMVGRPSDAENITLAGLAAEWAKRTIVNKDFKRHEIILILGGARAGKSEFALRLAAEVEGNGQQQVCFIATAEALDDEMRERIARHQSERPPAWITIEEPLRLDSALTRAADASVVIVDCITLLVSNWLLRAEGPTDDCQGLSAAIDAALTFATASNQVLILVSNEVGLGLVPDTPLGRQFRDTLGRVNQRLAQAADRVYLLVAGLPIRVKPSD
jgi:adenosylcobinamide kinase / adenosylcobinamide-phosphate guanylyltransferase